jgi:ABC-type transport system involved in multi-copper enzyme maturation permease subunit
VSRITAFALNTFREAMRNKLLYVILIFACVLIATTNALAKLDDNEKVRIIEDLGLTGTWFFAVVLSIVGGVTLVYQEIEKKTVYALLSKPLHRWQFVVGKYAGLALTLAVQMALMVGVLFVALAFQGTLPDGILARAVALIYVEVLVVTAVALLFSTFSTPLLSGLYTLGVTACGHFMPELRQVIGNKMHDHPSAAAGLDWATQLLPDLHLFSVSGATIAGHNVSIHGTYVGWGYVASASAYGLFFAACVLAIGMAVFARRDFV